MKVSLVGTTVLGISTHTHAGIHTHTTKHTYTVHKTHIQRMHSQHTPKAWGYREYQGGDRAGHGRRTEVTLLDFLFVVTQSLSLDTLS